MHFYLQRGRKCSKLKSIKTYPSDNPQCLQSGHPFKEMPQLRKSFWMIKFCAECLKSFKRVVWCLFMFFLWLEENENTDNTWYFSPDLIPSGEEKIKSLSSEKSSPEKVGIVYKIVNSAQCIMFSRSLTLSGNVLWTQRHLLKNQSPILLKPVYWQRIALPLTAGLCMSTLTSMWD